MTSRTSLLFRSPVALIVSVMLSMALPVSCGKQGSGRKRRAMGTYLTKSRPLLQGVAAANRTLKIREILSGDKGTAIAQIDRFLGTLKKTEKQIKGLDAANEDIEKVKRAQISLLRALYKNHDLLKQAVLSDDKTTKSALLEKYGTFMGKVLGAMFKKYDALIERFNRNYE